MTALLSLDPGLRATGAAILVDGVLRWCGLARSRDSHTGGGPDNLPDVIGAFEVSKDAAAQIRAACVSLRIAAFELTVIEWPRIRPPRPGTPRKDPNDLLPLPFVHGLTLAALEELRGRVCPISADRWTSGVPKEIRQTRFLASAVPAPALSAVERSLLEGIMPAGLRHNTVDAVHMGKWASEPNRFASLVRDVTPRARK